LSIPEPSLSINIDINDASSFIIWRPHFDRHEKKSWEFTLLVPSNDGKDLKLRGSVAIVFAPFSKSF